jgi:restriction system protein
MSGEIGGLRDLITEEVGCKSGLLLTDHEAGTILRRIEHSDADLFDGDRGRSVRVRPEDVEEIILHLRHRVGELPDAKHGTHDRIAWAVQLQKRGIDLGPSYEAFGTVVRSGKYKVLDEAAAAEMVELSGMAPNLVYQFLFHTATQLDRSMNWMYADTVDLKWAVPLAQIFESESIPDDPDCYLDQRYIDYFAQNDEDLSRIHWRNFERLTTEFFSRKGYEVLLGPGTNDGGVDVRVWPKGSDKSGPPLLLVQCKRHTEGNDVNIETVKAFWSFGPMWSMKAQNTD